MSHSRILAALAAVCLVQMSSAFVAQFMGGGGFPMGGGGFPMGGGGEGGEAAPGTGPPICSRSECVNYTVISTGPNYELRQYPAMTVVATQTTTRWMPAFVTYSRLLGYIKGKNSELVKMNMTYPVFKPQGGSGPKRMLAVIPSANLVNPPEPTSGKAQIETMPAMEVYARSFESSMFETNPSEAIRQFKMDLGPGVTLVPNKTFVAEYNSAYTFFGRHAELLLVSRYLSEGGEPVPQEPQPPVVALPPAQPPVLPPAQLPVLQPALPQARPARPAQPVAVDAEPTEPTPPAWVGQWF